MLDSPYTKKTEDDLIIEKTKTLGRAENDYEFLTTCSSFPPNYLIDFCRRSSYQCYERDGFEVALVSERQLHSSQERFKSKAGEVEVRLTKDFIGCSLKVCLLC